MDDDVGIFHKLETITLVSVKTIREFLNFYPFLDFASTVMGIDAKNLTPAMQQFSTIYRTIS